MRVAGLDLTVRKGEVVGLFGLLGAGCIEAALAIYGAWPGRREGAILVDGAAVAIGSPDDAVALGLGLMAQDRRDCLIGDQSVADNIGIASLGRIARHGMLDVAAGRRRALDQVDALSIKAPSIDAEVSTLSGGNQQKVQIARWLAADARILIMIDPTRGVDVGARREIKRIWSELGARGHAILLASTDAEELVDVCDRVVVMSHGRRVGELARRRSDRAGPAADGDRWLSRSVDRRGARAGASRRDGRRCCRLARGLGAAQLDAAAGPGRGLALLLLRHQRHVPDPAQPRAAGAADLDRQPRRDQRGDADRHPQLRPLGRLGGRPGRRGPGAADREARREPGARRRSPRSPAAC